MKKTKLLKIFFIFVLSLSIFYIHAAENDWVGYRLFLKSLRDTNLMIENTLTFLRTYNPKVGTTAHVTTGLEGKDYDELALKLSNGNGSYLYLLEVWTKRSSTWLKAMEFYFNNANTGEFIWHPHALVSTYTQGTMDRLVYNNTESTRSSTWEVEFSSLDTVKDRMSAVITEEGGYITIHMTIHLKTNANASGSNDAYLIGAKISTTAPNYHATLKAGAEEIGDVYDDAFNAWTNPNPYNAGLFNVNGFQTDGNTDGQYSGNTYPDPSSIGSSLLPSYSVVNAVSVSFTIPGDVPDFVN